MGVQGLWTLISPVARPINLETMGSKRLAIDSSIWLYQFQKAMRDREGKAIANAHILGFLRRISKLLYYGIKPVFVFDGGVPTLKRQTINDRKKRHRGVQDNLAKTAEKLLAAQLRQVAVTEAQKRSHLKATGDLITKDAVYFDQPIAQDFSEKNSRRKKRQSDPTDSTTTTPVPSPVKKPRFVPKDQYELPPVEKIPPVTATETDHRLATEMELKQFIHEFTPEDLDINSPHFQSLSTELKYEIIGDLRVKSRQPNRTRVEAMRKTNDHEFSQTQILNLKKRNDLTQKLLTVTDMVAKANLTIPVKIAAQRNKEYVLVKASEGWILGIENDAEKEAGSAKNPVNVGAESEDEDIEFEEVKVDGPAGRLRQAKGSSTDSEEDVESEQASLPNPPSKPEPNRQQQEADWRDAIRFHYGTRDPDSVVAVKETFAPKPKDGVNLFRQSEDDEDEVMRDIISELVAHESSHQPGLGRDLGEGSSKGTTVTTLQNKLSETPNQPFSTSANIPSLTAPRPIIISKEAINSIRQAEDDKDEVMRDIISELVAHQSSNQAGRGRVLGEESSKGTTMMALRNELNKTPNQHFSTSANIPSLTAPQPIITSKEAINGILESVELEEDDEFLLPSTIASKASQKFPVLETEKATRQTKEIISGSDLRVTESGPLRDDQLVEVTLPPIGSTSASRSEASDMAPDPDQHKSDLSRSQSCVSTTAPEQFPKELHSNGNITLSVVDPSKSSNLQNISSSPTQTPPLSSKSVGLTQTIPFNHSSTETNSNGLIPIDPTSKDSPSKHRAVHFSDTNELVAADKSGNDPSVLSVAVEPDLGNQRPRSESPEVSIPWSRTPTPERSMEKEAQAIGSDEEEFDRVIEAEEQAIDANLALESNEWERFLTGLEDQEKLEGIRQETDLEVTRLKEQKARDRRDADDVNIQMAQDIQNLLKLFGIPYVVSPMEAEAQCAELLKLGLVDGIITDDSDVFLFGGHRVYKNLFNQNKFVECYLLNDLTQELGLDQQKLIQLAFLLGSDYTAGLNGVGPVTAMEILSEFDPAFSTAPNSTTHLNPDLSGLLNFKKWWEKVQVGKDTELESGSSFRKKIRKKKDKIWIDDSWPNPAVAEAYLHPAVDHSTEKFVWGLPDLEGIREFLYDHLSWSSVKTDEVIIPLIKRQTQRLNGTVQTQGVLDGFFEYSVESNNKSSRLEPSRIESGFSSQRLQKIVQNWRQKKKQVADKMEERRAQEGCSSSLDEPIVERPATGGKRRAHPKAPAPKRAPKTPKTALKKPASAAGKPAGRPSSPPPARKPTRAKKELSVQVFEGKTRSSKRTQSAQTLPAAQRPAPDPLNPGPGSSSSDSHDSGSAFSFGSVSTDPDDDDNDDDDFQGVAKKESKKA